MLKDVERSYSSSNRGIRDSDKTVQEMDTEAGLGSYS